MTTDPNNPEILARVPSDIEAASLVSDLAARGIEASTTGGFTAGFRAEAPGEVNIIVRQADLARAKQALAEIEQQPSDIDWSKVDVGKPEDIQDIADKSDDE